MALSCDYCTSVGPCVDGSVETIRDNPSRTRAIITKYQSLVSIRGVIEASQAHHNIARLLGKQLKKEKLNFNFFKGSVDSENRL